MTPLSIPTAVTAAEAAELQRHAKGKIVLEVGALLGYSTILLAKVAERVHSVDPHVGYPASNPRPTLKPFLRNLHASNVRQRVTVHLGTDAEILPALRDDSFDMAFLDLTGMYDDTLACMERVTRLLKPGSVLCVHDCGHPEWPGAAEAVEDFSDEHEWHYDLVDRLAIFKVAA